MVSSTVYGFEDLLDRIYATLSPAELNYEVWMSHAGTMPGNPELTALENCRQAVACCDLFLSLILPTYGSGKEKPEDDSIVHEELRMAIHHKKPRWVLAHEHVVFARSLLNNLEFKGAAGEKNIPLKGHKGRKRLHLKRSPVFQDLRIIDMYELAIRQDVRVYRDRKGNWVQKFGSPVEACLFTVSQFRRYQEAEAFVSETFSDSKALTDAMKPKGGKP